MPGPTTEVLSDDLKDIRKQLSEMENRLVRLTSESNFIKTFFTLVFLALLTNACGGIWWNATISAKVDSTNARFDERSRTTDLALEQRFKSADLMAEQRFKAVELRADDHFKAVELRADDRQKVNDDHFKAIDARFDRLEAMLAKALARP